jgi:hypothetical protein
LIYNIKLTEGVGATLLIEDDREGRKMLERRDETDATDSERVRLDGESSELIGDGADGVLAIGMLVDRLLWLGVGSPSLDSTRIISYCPASLDSTVGARNDVSYASSGPGSIVDIVDGVYSNRLELIDCCVLSA